MNRKLKIAGCCRPAARHRLRHQQGLRGAAFGCPVGDTKVSSMEDLVRAKTVVSRRTVQATEMRCSKSGDLIRIDANLNNDSRSVKRVAYKFAGSTAKACARPTRSRGSRSCSTTTPTCW